MSSISAAEPLFSRPGRLDSALGACPNRRPSRCEAADPATVQDNALRNLGAGPPKALACVSGPHQKARSRPDARNLAISHATTHSTQTQCTTWFEYEGARYGEQTFIIDISAYDIDAFVLSLRVAEHAHPGFCAAIHV